MIRISYLMKYVWSWEDRVFSNLDIISSWFSDGADEYFGIFLFI